VRAVLHCVRLRLRLCELRVLQDDIEAELRCTASAGISQNIMLARMATRMAKPNGQYYLKPGDVLGFLANEAVRNLPGVGWSIGGRLKEMGVITCAQLRELSKASLQAEFGDKTGATLHDFCRGIDTRPLKENEIRKSISVEITWGVRFADMPQVEQFLRNLTEEVVKRLTSEDRKGRKVSLKVKVRKPGAKSSMKHLGHGPCDDKNKTHLFHAFTDSVDDIAAACIAMFQSMGVPALEVRGVGISIHQLTLPGQEPGPDARGTSKPLTSFYTSRSATHGEASTAAMSAITSGPRGLANAMDTPTIPAVSLEAWQIPVGAQVRITCDRYWEIVKKVMGGCRCSLMSHVRGL